MATWQDYTNSINDNYHRTFWDMKDEYAKRGAERLKRVSQNAQAFANGEHRISDLSTATSTGAKTVQEQRNEQAYDAALAKRAALMGESYNSAVKQKEIESRTPPTMPTIREEDKSNIEYRLKNYLGETDQHVSDPEFEADMQNGSYDYIATKYGQNVANYIQGIQDRRITNLQSTVGTYDPDIERRSTAGEVARNIGAGASAFVATAGGDLLDLPTFYMDPERQAPGKDNWLQSLARGWHNQVNDAQDIYNNVGNSASDAFYQQVSDETFEDTLETAKQNIVRAGSSQDKLSAGAFLKNVVTQQNKDTLSPTDISKTTGGLFGQIAAPEFVVGSVAKAGKAIKNTGYRKLTKEGKTVKAIEDSTTQIGKGTQAVEDGVFKAPKYTTKEAYGGKIDEYEKAIKDKTGKSDLYKARDLADKELKAKYIQELSDKIKATPNWWGRIKGRAKLGLEARAKSPRTYLSAAAQGGFQYTLSHKAARAEAEEKVLSKIDGLTDNEIKRMRMHDAELDAFIKLHPELSEKEAVKLFAKGLVDEFVKDSAIRDGVMFGLLSPYAKAAVGFKEGEGIVASLIADSIRDSAMTAVKNTAKFAASKTPQVIKNSTTATVAKYGAKGAGVAGKYAVAPAGRIAAPTAMMGGENAIQGYYTGKETAKLQEQALVRRDLNPSAVGWNQGVQEGLASMIPGLPGMVRGTAKEGQRAYEGAKNAINGQFNTQRISKQQEQANLQAQQTYQNAGLGNASSANYQAQRSVLSGTLNVAKAAANTLNKLASQNIKMQQNQNLYNSGTKQRSWFDRIKPNNLGNEQYAVDTLAAAQDQEKEWHTSLANDMNNIAKPTAKKTGNTFNKITDQDIHQVVSTGDGDALKQKLMLNGIEEAKATQMVEAIKQDTELAELRKTLSPFDGRIFRDNAQNVNPKNASPEQKTYAFSQAPGLDKVKKGSVVADANGNTFTVKAVDKKGNTVTLEDANGTVQNAPLDTFKQIYKDADNIQQTLKTTMGEAQAVLDMANQQKAEIQKKIADARTKGQLSLDPAKVKPGSFIVKVGKNNNRIDTLRVVEVKTDPNTQKVSYVVDLIDNTTGQGATRLTLSYDFLKNKATTLEDIQPSYVANSANVDSIKNTTKANASAQGTEYYTAQMKYANTKARIMKENAHYAALGKYNKFTRILQGKAGQIVADMRNKVLNAQKTASYSMSGKEYASALRELFLNQTDGIATLLGWTELGNLEKYITSLENATASTAQEFYDNLKALTGEATKLIQKTIDNSLDSADSDAEKRLMVNQGLAAAQVITDIVTIQTSMFIQGLEKTNNLTDENATASILGLRHIAEMSLSLKNTYADILGRDKQNISDTIFGQVSDMFIGGTDMAVTDRVAQHYLYQFAKNALKSDGFLGIILNSITEANNADYAFQLTKLNTDIHNVLAKQHKAYKIFKEYLDFVSQGNISKAELDNFWNQETCSL